MTEWNTDDPDDELEPLEYHEEVIEGDSEEGRRLHLQHIAEEDQVGATPCIRCLKRPRDQDYTGDYSDLCEVCLSEEGYELT